MHTVEFQLCDNYETNSPQHSLRLARFDMPIATEESLGQLMFSSAARLRAQRAVDTRTFSAGQRFASKVTWWTSACHMGSVVPAAG